MVLSTVCPRCRGSVRPDDIACPRCGLSLPGHAPVSPQEPSPISANGASGPLPEEIFQPETETQRLDYYPTQDSQEPSSHIPVFDPISASTPAPLPQPNGNSPQPSPSTLTEPVPNVEHQVIRPRRDTGSLSRVVGPRSSGPLGEPGPQPYTGPLDRTTPSANTGTFARTGSLNSTGPLMQTGPLNYTGPLVYTGPLTNTGALAPQGALQLLPQEAIAYQMGALYLTNKRVILLAPTVVRSAFIRDIDAVGTLTERASSMNLFFGGLSILLAAGAVWANGNRATVEPIFSPLYAHPLLPLLLAAALALLGVFLLAKHFFWIKRSLFVSVKGRPLITVSMTDWNSRRLLGMDSFVNAFFQIKDYLTGDLVERHMTGELNERQFTGGLSDRQLTGGLHEPPTEP